MKNRQNQLYKKEYVIFIINEEEYVIDVFYSSKEFREAYNHLNTEKTYKHTDTILSRCFNGQSKSFISNGERLTVEFHKLKPEEMVYE